ncbi:hypothetical protein [Glaciihabitans sp. dw_435]|uniref:hypothetical protein n=1 Tax=Glaciihabitans sp. dw_435 TaxID=2720081 RepID=UPI001BD60F0D|nr:hypothetical protein [Glaciihabitans sp. dw_435]
MEFAIAGVAVLFIIYLFAYPGWRRWEIAREQRLNPRKKPSGGLLAPFDEVFHPAAYAANLLWEAEKTIPAPTPDSDKSWPDLNSGRITISISDKGDSVSK